MYKSNLNYSSFWLDKSIWDEDDDVSKVEKKSNDLMKLMSYKRSIGNFVSIVTGESIPVTFDGRGNDSYTDGQEVVISAKLDDKEFDPVVGLALHEGSHIKLTDFDSLRNLMDHNIFPVSMQEIVKPYQDKSGVFGDDWWSVGNDIKGKLKDLLNYVEDRRIDNFVYSSAPGYRGYYESMYKKYFHSNVVDKGLKSSEHRDETWESYMFRLINITNKNRDLSALKGLKEIWSLLDLRNISRLKNTDESLELAGKIYKVIQKNVDDYMDQMPESQKSNGGEDGDTDGKSEVSDSQSKPTGDGKPMTGKGKGKGTDSDGDGKDDGSTDKKGSMSSGQSNKNGAGGQHQPLNDRQKKMLENAIEKQKKFQNGDITKKKISKADKKKIDTLDTADIKTEVTGKGLEQGYWRNQSQGVQTYVINNMTQQLIESGLIDHLGYWRTDSNKVAVDKGIMLGTQLGKKLKTRNEERVLQTPRMKSGKLNGRMLHEIGFGNFDIFDQININTATPSLLHISIDASSSMNGDKWYNTQTAAVAIAKAASMTENMNVVISYRGIYYNRESRHCQPLMLVAYDSRKDKFSKIQNLFKHISPSGTTPEGLCFEAVLKELTKTKNGEESYLINFSDGWPGFDNREISYNGQYAVDHTAEQVKKIRQSGVSVLSYFISDGYYGNSKSQFEKMYGKDSEFIDVNNVTQLAKTLNKKFEVKI